MDKLEIYNRCREVPKEAQKAIAAGRLKGKTDINPMWRIKKLTELFGPAGSVGSSIRLFLRKSKAQRVRSWCTASLACTSGRTMDRHGAPPFPALAALPL